MQVMYKYYSKSKQALMECFAHANETFCVAWCPRPCSQIGIRYDNMKRTRLEHQLGLQFWESQSLDGEMNSILSDWITMSCSGRSCIVGSVRSYVFEGKVCQESHIKGRHMLLTLPAVVSAV